MSGGVPNQLLSARLPKLRKVLAVRVLVQRNQSVLFGILHALPLNEENWPRKPGFALPCSIRGSTPENRLRTEKRRSPG
jgi:hypothetical protein